MKFNDLYNRVFVQEQDEVASPDQVAVEPAPMPEAPVEGDTGGGPAPVNLTQHIQKCKEFAKYLHDLDGGDCVLKFVADISKPGTPFEGIQEKTSPYIIAAAANVLELAGKLSSYTFLKK